MLRVSRMSGRDTSDGCHATQERTSAGLHTNLEQKTDDDWMRRMEARGSPRASPPNLQRISPWLSEGGRIDQIRRTLVREDTLRPLAPGGPCMSAPAAARSSGAGA